MSLLEQLKKRKDALKSTVTNITHADGSQEQIVLSKCGNQPEETTKIKLKPKSFGFVVDTKPDLVPACILTDFLYLGSQDSVNFENVQNYHLTDIISVGIEAPASDIVFGDGQNSTVGNHFIECLDLPETNLETIIKQTNDIIKSVHGKSGRVLIHCNAGVSRSSSVVIAYLMLVEEMSYDEAFALVKSKRECIRPNDGFMKQLKHLKPID